MLLSEVMKGFFGCIGVITYAEMYCFPYDLTNQMDFLMLLLVQLRLCFHYLTF